MITLLYETIIKKSALSMQEAGDMGSIPASRDLLEKEIALTPVLPGEFHERGPGGL